MNDPLGSGAPSAWSSQPKQGKAHHLCPVVPHYCTDHLFIKGNLYFEHSSKDTEKDEETTPEMALLYTQGAPRCYPTGHLWFINSLSVHPSIDATRKKIYTAALYSALC